MISLGEYTMRYVSCSRIDGRLSAPASKSFMQRLVAAAVLANGPTEITDPSDCDDARAALEIARRLGAEVSVESDRVRIKGGLIPGRKTLPCGESGLSMRMFTPIAGLLSGPVTLTGAGTLCSRPMGMMVGPLEMLGVRCKTRSGHAPLEVCGPLQGGSARVDGSISSQFLTGLLLALPRAPVDSTLDVPVLRSAPYIRATLSVLQEFGVVVRANESLSRFEIPGRQVFWPHSTRVEGDWSGAAMLLVAGAVGGRVEVTGLRSDSVQADRAILDALRAAGAIIRVEESAIVVERDRLVHFEFDAVDCPDLFPPLVALAAHCTGHSRIHGANRLRHKESDRALALVEEFAGLGVSVTQAGNTLEVEGGRIPGGRMNSRGDHRMAMAGALAGIGSEQGVEIEHWECVSKSYPGFFDDLEHIMGDRQ